MITIENTTLSGVKLIKPTCFEDYRGEYLQIYNDKEYKEQLSELTNENFIEDDISVSTKHVLKGIHGDSMTWKLISCLYGKFYLVVIDYRIGDSNNTIENNQFGKWQGFTLSDVNKYQVLIPPGFGNGHICLSDKSIFHYKQTNYYNPKNQFTIKWNDSNFNIRWPINNPIISLRDELGDIKHIGK
jgi:dTDP-4-dehydrorhamnose 3,5-epimerase